LTVKRALSVRTLLIAGVEVILENICLGEKVV